MLVLRIAENSTTGCEFSSPLLPRSPQHYLCLHKKSARMSLRVSRSRCLNSRLAGLIAVEKQQRIGLGGTLWKCENLLGVGVCRSVLVCLRKNQRQKLKKKKVVRWLLRKGEGRRVLRKSIAKGREHRPADRSRLRGA